jgi:glycosyltransferase involved in cell wall biosynthesis
MRMRIVVCDYSGHPFQIELSRCLAKRGHAVLHLHFTEFQTPKGAMTALPDDPATFAVEGVSLGRPFDKDRFLRRRFQEVEIGKRIAARALEFRPDVVIGCNMPLDAQHRLQRACAKAGIGFVFWLQDVYSAAIGHYLGERLGLPGRIIGRYYRHLEGRMLRASDAVVAISEKFRTPLSRWGVRPERIAVIPNWAPLSEIRPVEKDNDWARRHGLTDTVVALYTGTLGLKHDPALLLDLARAGAAGGLRVVVASEGKAANWLAAQAAAGGIGNLTVLPFQPMEQYPQVLGAGEIMLAMVGAEAASFSVPSKILSYLAAGKPIVAAIDAGNDAARTIEQAGAGSVTAPGDTAAFVDRVLALAADPALRATMGANGRAFAEQHFAIDRVADGFETLIGKVTAR